VTRSNVASWNGSAGRSAGAATTCTPRGRNRRASTGTLGNQPSTATVNGANAGSDASISPPPESTSSMRVAAGARRATRFA